MLKWIIGVAAGILIVAAIGTGIALAVLPDRSETVVSTPGPAIVPSNVNAHTQVDPLAIEVDWMGAILPDTTAVLQRSTDDMVDSWQDLVTLEAGATIYVDTDVEPGKTYHYRVYASSSDGSAGISIVASATVPD